MESFDSINIDLEGKNLIEASAGTGKTHSIGILLLRMLLEKNIRIEEILMVTFTNAAVAELEIRIRKFLREAYKITGDFSNKNIDQLLCDDNKTDENICKLVKRSIKEKGRDEIKRLLKNAILFLDETSIFTIHGFAQFTLSEFAFETGQLFNTEIIEDQESIIEDVVNEYWRKNIAVLDLKILKILANQDFTRKKIIDFAKDIFNGKELSVKNDLSKDDLLETIKKKEKEFEQAKERFVQTVKDNWSTIRQNTVGTYSLKSFIENDDPEGFADKYQELFNKKDPSQYLFKFDFLLSDITSLIAAENGWKEFQIDIMVYFLDKASGFLIKEVEKKKNRNQMLSFHDLISKLHQEVVVNDKKTIREKLRKKYKCVFIDEFQDTDHLQYEIFKKVFVDKGNTIVFFIGDPKQSIYAWRGADINTYIKAKENIKKHYTMKQNYRSTKQLVAAMNEFFPLGTCGDNQKSNPFCSEHITYEEVDAGNKNLAELYRNNNPAQPFEIIDYPKKLNKKDILFGNTAVEVLNLLRNYYLVKHDEKKRVKPGNIGILVRTNKEAKLMKKNLSGYAIPAIIIDETKVMETDEAMDLYYVIFAILNPNTSNVSRAAATSFTDITTEKLAIQDMDNHKSIFLELQKNWKESGIYSAILSFINQYGIRKYLLDPNTANGNRIYTNLMQLTDILNEKETFDNYGPEKLVDWLKKSTEGFDTLNKYEQRLESDDDAVKISTIHKSKGLSYDIVLLPYSNFKIKPESKIEKIVLLENGKFTISYYKTSEEIERYNSQQEEENRRLLYVAITRAKYKCIINYDGKEGTLNKFIDSIGTESCKFINIREPETEIEGRYIPESKKEVIDKKPIVFTGKIENKWHLTSYSGLDIHSLNPVWKKEITPDDFSEYDKFIFSELPKGVQSGLIIHKIFEKIDFSDDTYWNKTIENTLKYSGRKYSKEELSKFEHIILNTVEAELPPANFKLSDIKQKQRFNELEFFFSFDNWKGNEIKKILPQITISDQQIEGIMHGFIDLLFEHRGKYYILDWKTNYLGNTLEKYNPDQLESTMTENNYHLQYYIYTIAAKRFLETRLPDFDYDQNFGGIYYLFIRGMRTGKNTGIFFKKPKKETIFSLEKLMTEKKEQIY